MGSYDGLFACQRDSFLKEVKVLSHVICLQLIHVKYIVMYCWNGIHNVQGRRGMLISGEAQH